MSTGSAPTRAVPTAMLVGVGSVLAAANLLHLTEEVTPMALVLGGVVPALLSLAVVAIGLLGWRRDWSASAIRRLLFWLTFGMGWMVIVGVGASVYVLSEGGRISHEWFLLVTFASYGTVPALVTGWYDLERRRREGEVDESNEALRRERDFLTRIEDLANVGGWEHDLDTGTLRWTEGGRSIRDLSGVGSLTFEEALESYRGPDREKVEQAIETCRRRGIPFDLEVRLHTATGRVRWVQLRGERVDAHDGPVIRGVIRDISGQKERQQRLAVINRIVRHNLRNDLNVIAGNAGLLEAELADRSDPEHATDLRETAATIEGTSRDVLQVVEKTQRFEEAIQTDVVVEPVALRSLLDALVEDFEERYPRAAVELDATAVEVATDPSVLGRILTELLDNAIAHNDREHPTVRIRVGDADGGSVAIRVTDDGPGIPEMELAVLESGEETPLMHGSGVGLWIVDWLTTRIDASLAIDAGDEGTTVTLSLPVVDA